MSDAKSGQDILAEKIADMVAKKTETVLKANEASVLAAIGTLSMRVVRIESQLSQLGVGGAAPARATQRTGRGAAAAAAGPKIPVNAMLWFTMMVKEDSEFREKWRDALDKHVDTVKALPKMDTVSETSPQFLGKLAQACWKSGGIQADLRTEFTVWKTNVLKEQKDPQLEQEPVGAAADASEGAANDNVSDGKAEV